MNTSAVTILHSPSNLVIDTGTYELVGVTTGGRTWRRRTVEGPYAHGRVLLGAVVDTDTLMVQARVRGANWAAVHNAYNTLLGAVSRMSYQVKVALGGTEVTYDCEPADVAAPVEKFRFHANMLEVTLSIPVRPQ